MTEKLPKDNIKISNKCIAFLTYYMEYVSQIIMIKERKKMFGESNLLFGVRHILVVLFG